MSKPESWVENAGLSIIFWQYQQEICLYPNASSVISDLNRQPLSYAQIFLLPMLLMRDDGEDLTVSTQYWG